VLTYKEANTEIKSIKKEDRKDISNYIATLEDGSTIGIEASSKKEAEEKIKKHLKTLELSV